MNKKQIEAIYDMLASGMTAAEVAEVIGESEPEDADAEAFEEAAYGRDDHTYDNWTHSQVSMHDRMSLGRNDAGEWLGFM